MGEPTTFESEIDAEILDELRRYAAATGRSISSVLTEAVAAHLARARSRLTFLEAADEVLEDHRDLLDRLAQ